MGASLYERIGGEGALIAAVNLFYAKVMADSRTRPYFAKLDMVSQTRKQIAFMAWAFGGPSEYKGRDLKTAHAELVAKRGLSDTHFDAVAHHLRATLVELGVSADDVGEAMAIIASTRPEVLGR
jgi:hemoglobin